MAFEWAYLLLCYFPLLHTLHRITISNENFRFLCNCSHESCLFWNISSENGKFESFYISLLMLIFNQLMCSKWQTIFLERMVHFSSEKAIWNWISQWCIVELDILVHCKRAFRKNVFYLRSNLLSVWYNNLTKISHVRNETNQKV